MISKHAQNHPKVDYTILPHLDDLQACSKSSKIGIYKTSNFGRCKSSRSGYTKHPISDDLKTCSFSSTIGMCQLSKFG